MRLIDLGRADSAIGFKAAGVESGLHLHGILQSDHAPHGEPNINNEGMKSISFHSRDDEVARYTKAASQSRLAVSVMTGFPLRKSLTYLKGQTPEPLWH